MARAIWKKRSWLRRVGWRPGTAESSDIPHDHGLFPGSYFQEKLLQERYRALRTNKPLVVMVLDAEKVGYRAPPGTITDSLGDAVNASVRESDICGLLKEDRLVGVILTEVEVEKVDAAQQVVAQKTREKLDAVLSHELAEEIAISFHVFPAVRGSELFDQNSSAGLIATGERPGE